MSKKTRRATKENRCPRCRINFNRCFCSHIIPVNIETPVHILMHVNETNLTSNTSRLAELMIPNCEIHIRGTKEKLIPWDKILTETHQALFLFPCETSVELNQELIESYNRPISLIVPDGSWRQAKKFKKREENLSKIPSVHIPFLGESEYKLRKSPFKEAVCTYEAIARSIGIIDGQNIRDSLEIPFREMVTRTLQARAKL